MRGKPEFEAGFFAGLLRFGVDVGFHLGGHFFDAARLDSAIFDEGFHRPARDFAADRIEAADGDDFRGIVDHEVDAQGLFQDADVAAFAADDAALQFIGRKRNDGDGAFGRDFLRVLIASEREQIAGFVLRGVPGFVFLILDIGGDFARHLILDPGQDFVVGFLDDMPETFSSSVKMLLILASRSWLFLSVSAIFAVNASFF
jgi:hypothetical protein